MWSVFFIHTIMPRMYGLFILTRGLRLREFPERDDPASCAVYNPSSRTQTD